MKANQQLRQNKKVARHFNKFRFPVPKDRNPVQRVLGDLLPEVPGVPKVLTEILIEFNFPITKPKEIVNDYLSPEDQTRIDWSAVRKALEAKLRDLPDFLPKELTVYQKIVEYKKSLPKKVTFTEPATHKLKIDVRKLYKVFVRLYNFTADNLALPWVKAADNFYAAAADNLYDFLKTGIAKEIPSNWVDAVQTIPVFGEKVVMVIAGELADPEETAERFKGEFAKTFKRRKPLFTKTDAYVSDLIRKRLEGAAYKDITMDYIRENDLEFDAASDDDWKSKEQLEDNIKHSIQNALKRLDSFTEEKT